ncbi:hypothetical protein MIMGU_mgv1a025197mg [Erythranthe guttata]|uniref:Cytochrome P450 n=2 Tax=Erythranthe guttata TaxID=4155 RepID=A0A022PPU1_ERYGU|nr:hypothetical protein MIMGU_mgv1a025197mg [Erythranthe guttata]
MQEIQFHPYTFPLLTSLFLFSLFLITKWFNKPSLHKKTLPSSPRKLPILGNLHQVGTLPHRNLLTLAKKHGPFMLLHFGNVPVLISSSADSAREIMKTHDTNFANRLQIKAFRKLLYGCKDVVTAPYGEYWRQMKSIFVLQLLSNKRVQSFRQIREEETAFFVKRIEEYSSLGSTMNLTKMFSELTVDGICRSALGHKYSDSENGKKFLMLLADLAELLGAISIGDFIPWLSWINRVNGFDKKMDRVAKELDDFIEGVIQEHMETPKGKNGENFVDILLEIYDDDNADFSSFDRDSIKALLLDVFIAGTDTISTSLEWTMTELLRNPSVMDKLQNEVRIIVGGSKHDITDEHLEKMDYLKAVIKESLRYHPPIPIVVPRVADKDVKIMGYDISKGTIVMVNAWAIGRDPQSWDEPEKFEPERFLKNSKNENIDFRGFDFELIPFGAGRRGCPGISFAVATIEFVLANIVHKFNWELPDGLRGKDLDVSESPGNTVHKAIPLLTVATLNI